MRETEEEETKYMCMNQAYTESVVVKRSVYLQVNINNAPIRLCSINIAVTDGTFL